MSSRAAAATGTEKVGRLVSSRLRIIQRDYLTRRGGRTHQLRSSVAIDYTPTYVAAYKNDPAQCPRLIDAEAVHGDEQAFWSARREFYRGGASRSYYPTWDRQAQALILFTRDVPRIPQEAAFRLFILGLRMTLLPRLVAGAELMLPSWITMNAEGFLGEGLEGKTANADSGSKAPAAAAATGATSPSSTPSEVPGDGNSATEAEKK
ncbi:hypothetical protein JKF63_07893 [Porcisia hertigi]|uniref:Uncharacterized protein n=1 Tax=Porcisia hertigi TaxID=2761500 RepID=A0A836LJQ1_9TRYP|nr:hypothetical protein JKF63_07893 [Porcisia hertigi]